jgi:predicted PurR-regulated permease PerM
MFDGITILIYPFFLIPIISIVFAYIIDYIREYIHQRRREQIQLEYLSIIVILSSNQQEYPPPYESLFLF